ncbi:MAG: aminoglycoside phosphotransferase family protein [Mycobacteriales bacterium]
MRYPEAFVRNVLGVYGERAGRVWLDELPDLLAAMAERWELTVGDPYRLSFNYVARAVRADGSVAVLKLTPPVGELRFEAAALRHFAGAGAVRLLAADVEAGALLLERASPGGLLTAVQARDDDEATRIAAGVGRRLHRPAAGPFRTVADWARDAFGWLRRRYRGGTGPLPAELLDRAEAEHAELVASAPPPVMLHGDLHHHNILTSDRGWLAIDPHGVLGEPAYEAGPLLRNPAGLGGRADLLAVLARRVPILAEAYGVDPERIRGWGRAHSAVSVIWSHQDAGRVDTDTLAVLAALS